MSVSKNSSRRYLNQRSRQFPPYRSLLISSLFSLILFNSCTAIQLKAPNPENPDLPRLRSLNTSALSVNINYPDKSLGNQYLTIIPLQGIDLSNNSDIVKYAIDSSLLKNAIRPDYLKNYSRPLNGLCLKLTFTKLTVNVYDLVATRKITIKLILRTELTQNGEIMDRRIISRTTDAYHVFPGTKLIEFYLKKEIEAAMNSVVSKLLLHERIQR